jgi:hypothetical protein
LNLPRNAAVRSDPWTFFRGGEIRLDDPVLDIAGSETLGCYLDENGAWHCTTNRPSLAERCQIPFVEEPEEMPGPR